MTTTLDHCCPTQLTRSVRAMLGHDTAGRWVLAHHPGDEYLPRCPDCEAPVEHCSCMPDGDYEDPPTEIEAEGLDDRDLAWFAVDALHGMHEADGDAESGPLALDEALLAWYRALMAEAGRRARPAVGCPWCSHDDDTPCRCDAALRQADR